MRINQNGNIYQERYYIAGGSYERDRLPNGEWRNLTYINTPAGLSAVFIQNEKTQQEDFYFVHTDYQGSIMAIADFEGEIIEEYSYDPWGNRRDPNTWQNIYTNSENPPTLDLFGGLLYRGYTAHEHLDCFALINMNGRMYDPVLGRMLSADNFAHSGTQGLNRYSYVFNNPLKYTDPSGEWIWAIPAAVGFTIGYVSHGLSTGDWGWSAVGAGAIGAAVAVVGFYSGGATSAASIAQGFSGVSGHAATVALGYSGRYAVSAAVSSLMPSISIPIGNKYSLNFSAGIGFG